MRTITQSELRCFRQCPRKHRYRYGLRIRPATSSHALRFGTLVHRGLESWCRATRMGITGEERLATALDAMQPNEEVDELDCIKASIMLAGYEARWGGEDIEILGEEVQFRMPLVNPLTGRESQTFELAGKLDAIVRMGGALRVLEHKTSGADIGLGSLYWEALTLDGQVSIYLDGLAHIAGERPEGCLYDVLGKPKLSPLQATPIEQRKYTKKGELYAAQRAEDETLDEYAERLKADVFARSERYFQRGIVVRIGDELEEARYDTWVTARLIREAEVTGRFARNPDACVSYGTKCEYLPLCTHQASQDDDTLYRVAESEHEELKQ